MEIDCSWSAQILVFETAPDAPVVTLKLYTPAAFVSSGAPRIVANPPLPSALGWKSSDIPDGTSDASTNLALVSWPVTLKVIDWIEELTHTSWVNDPELAVNDIVSEGITVIIPA